MSETLFPQMNETLIPFEDFLSQIHTLISTQIKILNWPVESIILRQNSKSYSLCVSEPQQYFHMLAGYPKTTSFLTIFVPPKKKPNNVKLEMNVGMFECTHPPAYTISEMRERKKKKEDGTFEITYYYRVTADQCDSHMVAYIESIIKAFTTSYRSAEPSFGCCHRYAECSDAQKCLHPNLMFSTACQYRHNLETNRIFYGKNKNNNQFLAERKQIMKRYIVIDFETANPKRVSACAIGVALIEDGKVTERFTSLIKPPDIDFAPMNVKIHHITPEMVEDAPTFAEIYPNLRNLAAGCPIVGYSKFDRSVLRSLRDHYMLPIDDERLDDYIDVCEEAKLCLPELKNHKLKTVAKHFGIEDFKHHDPADDAYICACVFIRLFSGEIPQKQSKDKTTIDRMRIARAFAGFVDAILCDGVIDYKEVIELKYFLEVIPTSNTIQRLRAQIDSILDDGICSHEESEALSRALKMACNNLWE